MDQRILCHYSKGHKALTIAKLLQEEQLKALSVGVVKFIKHLLDTGTIARKLGSGYPSEVTKHIVMEQMQKGDETTVYQLHQL